MSRPKPLYPNRTAILPSRYLGSIDYYAVIMAYPHVVIDDSMRFDKRCKPTHRCNIADTHGRLMLTVPIEKPISMTEARWKDINVSGHNSWWNIHVTAMQSAYGRTPFFEFYIDSFLPILNATAEGRKLTGMNADLDRLVRKILDIDTDVTYNTSKIDFKYPTDDFRNGTEGFITEKEYYQIWGFKYGFTPGLSIVDLIFNKGPEASVYIHRMLQERK